MADRIYRVGKRTRTRLVPAFKLTRLASGGIRLTDLHDVSDLDRTVILAHFGRSLHSTTGTKDEQHRRVFKPGTKEHFAHAVHELPAPFALMRKSK